MEQASQKYIETERELRQKAHRGQFGDIIPLFSLICFFFNFVCLFLRKRSFFEHRVTFSLCCFSDVLFLSLAKSFRTNGIGKLKVTLIEGVDLIASDPNGEFYMTLGFPIVEWLSSDFNPPLARLETKNMCQVPHAGKCVRDDKHVKTFPSAGKLTRA